MHTINDFEVLTYPNTCTIESYFTDPKKISVYGFQTDTTAIIKLV